MFRHTRFTAAGYFKGAVLDGFCVILVEALVSYLIYCKIRQKLLFFKGSSFGYMYFSDLTAPCSSLPCSLASPPCVYRQNFALTNTSWAETYTQQRYFELIQHLWC